MHEYKILYICIIQRKIIVWLLQIDFHKKVPLTAKAYIELISSVTDLRRVTKEQTLLYSKYITFSSSKFKLIFEHFPLLDEDLPGHRAGIARRSNP